MLTLLLLVTGCSPSLHVEEQLELLGMNGDGAVLHMRWTQSNMELLRGQGRLRVDWLGGRGQEMRQSLLSPPSATELSSEGARFLSHSMLQEGGQWRAQMKTEALSISTVLEPHWPAMSPLELTRGERSWSLGAPVPGGKLTGYISAPAGDVLIDGRGLILRRGGNDPPWLRGVERISVFTLGSQWSIGVDQIGSQALAWVLLNDRQMPAQDARIERTKPGRFLVDFRPGLDVVLQVRALRGGLRTPLLSDWTLVERWFFRRQGGEPRRSLRRAQITLEAPGVRERMAGALLTLGYAP